MAETPTYYYASVPVALPQGYYAAQPGFVPAQVSPQTVVAVNTAPQGVITQPGAAPQGFPTETLPPTPSSEPLQVPAQGIHQVIPWGVPQGMPQPAAQAIPQQTPQAVQTTQDDATFDYSFVKAPARIAVYDDLLSEPRVITVAPAPTTDFIGALAASIWQQAQAAGGNIAYSIILQVAENFIHARFSEMVVSIFNNGKTIRFSDQGPGFKNKDLALQPGFSSATQQMKQYIKGVGSGLPSVQEWLQVTNGAGRITIDDNLNGGAVVTLSLEDDAPTPAPEPLTPAKPAPFHMPTLTEKEQNYLLLMYREGALRITDFVEYTGVSKGTVAAGITKLQELRLVENELGTKRRVLTELGVKAAEHLLREAE